MKQVNLVLKQRKGMQLAMKFYVKDYRGYNYTQACFKFGFAVILLQNPELQLNFKFTIQQCRSSLPWLGVLKETGLIKRQGAYPDG